MTAAHRRAQPAAAPSNKPIAHGPSRPTGPAKRLVAILVALLGLAVPAAAQATTYGADIGSQFRNQAVGQESAAQVVNSLKALYAAGGRVGRADTGWGRTESQAPVHGRHRYNWSSNDTLIGEMAQARLRWQPDLDFAPRWSQGKRSPVIRISAGRFIATLPPIKNAYFAAYATDFMRRYGRGGSFWRSHPSLPYLPVTTLEVWNEPDNKHNWGAAINLGAYGRMYEAVRSAIHRVDHHAQVVTGGLAWTPTSLPRLLKAMRGMPVDGVAFHPYAATPRGTIGLAKTAISLMRRYGRGRTPLLADEYGWTSIRGTFGTTARKNVDNYSYQGLVGLSKLHLEAVLPFLWGDPSWGLSNGTFARALTLIHKHH